MTIGGFMPFSLSDFPGLPAAVVFTQGCNFRCPFCHNGGLLGDKPGAIAVGEILDSLRERRRFVQGVVISGGEPCLQSTLPGFCSAVKDLGLRVKLDTNGSRPVLLERLLRTGWVDYVAMDVKAPPHRYAELAGADVEWRTIRRSMDIIAGSGVQHHFRTTVVTPLLTDRDIDAIRRLLPPGSNHVLQEFRPELALDPALRRGRPDGCVPLEDHRHKESHHVHQA
jgi:pyruvate formate lyase activating enzyme